MMHSRDKNLSLWLGDYSRTSISAKSFTLHILTFVQLGNLQVCYNFCFKFLRHKVCDLSPIRCSYAAVCPPVRGDNPRALMIEFSPVREIILSLKLVQAETAV